MTLQAQPLTLALASPVPLADQAALLAPLADQAALLVPEEVALLAPAPAGAVLAEQVASNPHSSMFV